MTVRSDAERIIQRSIEKVLPDEAVAAALKDRDFSNGDLYVVSVGKAAWRMAKAASDILCKRIKKGIVITKYDHVKGEIDGFDCFEAGHPIPDENSFYATGKAIELVSGLKKDDTVLFLLSGGGSALFEIPLIESEELFNVTSQLLSCGADIVEINTIRKRLSAVKGGKFAQLCKPAKIFSVVLSDVIGDPLDMIASGPAYPDSSTCSKANEIAEKYNLQLSEEAKKLLNTETPKRLDNVETVITGSVGNLCLAAKEECEKLGYETYILTDRLTCEAREAGSFLCSIARTHCNTEKSLAFIAGGESVVHIKGNGKGGRNQEIALSGACGLRGLENTAIISVGSDGTDGPTDAAGGYCDGETAEKLKLLGINIYDVLENNDSYNALKKTGGLIITGPTGTNVNDISVLLIKR